MSLKMKKKKSRVVSNVNSLKSVKRNLKGKMCEKKAYKSLKV